MSAWHYGTDELKKLGTIELGSVLTLNNALIM
jgi:hypothetical protein